jgi:tRNA threonylcarbamoyladenosine biosynthesis protein TsaE
MKKSISAEDTKKFAQETATKLLKNPQNKTGALVLALYGELGSGKTTFAQGFARVLGIQEPILSPTFTIIKIYQIPSPFKNFQMLYHVDCYRLQNEKELLELGWEEVISNPHNIVLVEWPERVPKAMPKESRKLSFTQKGGDKRDIIFEE